MGELINGRMKKEIKRILIENYHDCDDECRPDEPCNCPYTDDCHCGAVAAVPKSLIYDALSYIECLEAAQPKWIGVKERLPMREDASANELVLCVERDTVTGEILPGHIHAWHWEVVRDMGSDCFTHWMPLPEPTEEST